MYFKSCFKVVKITPISSTIDIETKAILFAAMTNQQLVDRGNTMMNETDQAIERSKKVGLSLKSFPCEIKFSIL